eukprot:173060_1
MALKARPSDERRAKLKASELHKTPSLSNLTPIQRYYTAASKLVQCFNDSVEKNKLDDAYIFGLRFAKFSTDVLPTHDYYRVKQREYINLRNQNQKDLQNVIDALENVVEQMDFEELERREIQRREEEARRKIQEREEKMRKEAQERAATQDLTQRLNQLNNLFPDVPSGVGDEQKNADLRNITPGATFAELDLPIGSLPPPIPFSQGQGQGDNSSGPPPYDAISSTSNAQVGGSAPPSAPPSYEALLGQRADFSNYRKDSIANLRPSSSRSVLGPNSQHTHSMGEGEDLTTFINPLAGPDHLLPASLEYHGEVENRLPSLELNIQTQISQQEYRELRAKRKIEVFQLSTYQGRNSYKDSTNGCTVISPLVAVNHLQSDGAGISDMKIEEIIDDLAPDVLSRVRRKLGLAGHALIIPSDVHDFMVDDKILKEEMFVGVCGGNLLASDHVNGFLNLLENGVEDQPSGSQEEKKDASKKVAAALFFHEHVVSILKVVLADGSSWYDLVDSLPSRQGNNSTSGATRTRCKDRKSLQTLLHWYACQKFSPADVSYIDKNEWDDHMGVFDPRVFQGFVWKEA